MIEENMFGLEKKLFIPICRGKEILSMGQNRGSRIGIFMIVEKVIEGSKI